jgi:hypothetical protein
MTSAFFSDEVRARLIYYFKRVIYNFLTGSARSEEYSADFYSLAKNIRKESEDNIRIISELAARLHVEEIEKKRINTDNISDNESSELFKKSIKAAYEKFRGLNNG